MKKKTIMLSVTILILIGFLSFGIIHHQKVEAERIAQEELDAKLKKEQEVLDKAKKAVDDAYDTRKEEDIRIAETAISKLSDNQRKDKTTLTDKLTKLLELLNQLDDVNIQLSKTKKSKSQADIDAAQQLIDKLTDTYLKNDKELAQEELNKLKEQLSKEKEQAEKAKKQELVAQESNEAPIQVETEQPSQQQYQEQLEQAYTPPVNNDTSTPTHTPPATGGGGSSSAGASQGGGGNAQTPTPPNTIVEDNISGTNNANGWEIDTGW